MGKRRQSRFRVRNLDLAQELERSRPAQPGAGALGVAAMDAQRFGQLERDGEARVQARQRVLEDHRHILADERPALRIRKRKEIPTGKGEAPGSYTPGEFDQPHQRQCGDALAGAGLADAADDLPRVERKIDSVDRDGWRALGAEFDAQILDFDQCHASILAG